MVVLGADALVTEPTIFTHVLRTGARFRRTADQDAPFEGSLPKGARVKLAARAANGRCRVVDERGVSVFVACSALRRVSPKE